LTSTLDDEAVSASSRRVGRSTVRTLRGEKENMRRPSGLLFGVVIGCIATFGCSGSSSVPGESTGKVDSGRDDAGSGDEGGGKADASDDGGSALAAFTTVSGGGVGHSAHYTFVGTLGQSPGGNDTSRSAKFQLRGGIVGATQAP
jgi:hypothetical protein